MALTQTLDDQLGNRLRQPVAVSSSQRAALGEHVDDRWDENPPVIPLVAVIEDAVLQPRLLVLIKP